MEEYVPLHRPNGPCGRVVGKVLEQRNANRQRLLDAAEHLPEGVLVDLQVAIPVMEYGELSYTYLQVDREYLYAEEPSGQVLKHSLAGNGWLAPMMKKLTVAIYRAYPLVAS